MSIKILTILGARPQFIKAATVSRAIRARDDIDEIIVHTGQHFDANMSDIFFQELEIPKPHYNFGIASLSHGAMTGRMLERTERLLQVEQPDWVLVYGDTNSTLAGALASAKLHVPVAHVESGLRSHNPAMPEEVNRILTDRVSTLLFCPTETAMRNLEQEGFPFPAIGNRPQRIENVGDVMYDAVLHYRELARDQVDLSRHGLEHQGYALCTLHRQENTDNPERLIGILNALREIAKELPVVLPLHPRTRDKLDKNSTVFPTDGLTLVEPLSYLTMQRLLMSAKCIFTDSGGLQKEAYFHQVPCVTLRDETEWLETVELGWNILTGADKEMILDAFQVLHGLKKNLEDVYGQGNSVDKIVKSLMAGR